MRFRSRSPALAIQTAVFATLSTHPAMVEAYQALSNPGAPRIYETDAVPADAGKITAKFPYTTIGDDEIVGDAPQLTDEAYVKVESWSRTTDNAEVKTLDDAVRVALSDPPDLAGHRVITWRFKNSLFTKEPDGLTRRAITTFIWLTQPAVVPL